MYGIWLGDWKRGSCVDSEGFLEALGSADEVCQWYRLGS